MDGLTDTKQLLNLLCIVYKPSFTSKFRQVTLTTDILLFGRTKSKHMTCGPIEDSSRTQSMLGTQVILLFF